MADKPRSLRCVVAYAAMLAGKLALLGALGSGAAVLGFWLPKRLVMQRFAGDDQRHEPMVYISEPPWTYNLTFDIPFFSYLPLLLLRHPRARRASLRGRVLVVLAYLTAYAVFAYVRDKPPPLQGLYMPASQLPNLVLLVSLWLLTTRTFALAAFKQMAVISVGLLLMQIAREILTSEEHRVLLGMVVLPIAKEIAVILSRFSAAELIRDAKAVRGDREPSITTWAYFQHVQIICALLVRAFNANLQDNGLLALALVSQTAFEIFMRISLEARRTVSSRAAECVAVLVTRRKGVGAALAHGASIAPANTLVAGDTVCSLDAMAGEKSFLTSVVMSEMVAEYVAIFLVPIIAVMFWEVKFNMPLDYFRDLPAPFSQSLDVWGLLKVTVSQLLFEFLADVCCTVFEVYSGFMFTEQLAELWAGNALRFLMYFMLCSATASAGFYAYVSHIDSIDLCMDMDACYCVGAGFSDGGLREQYCKLLYNETNGIPPAAL